METIYVIDLSTGTIQSTGYDTAGEEAYGRGLAHRLLREHVPLRAGRFSPDNATVIVPGLFAGRPAPSPGRLPGPA